MVKSKVVYIMLSSVLTLIPVPTYNVSASDELYVEPVVHITTPVDSLSTQELWAIFTLATTRWSNGEKITVLMYPSDNATLKAFVRDHFGVSVYRFQELVDVRVNTGKSLPPKIVMTEQEMIKEIEKKPGRIGFIRSHIVIGELNGIKRITIK
jgi:ABC-type phosphate transport system substrate-binding protein